MDSRSRNRWPPSSTWRRFTRRLRCCLETLLRARIRANRWYAHWVTEGFKALEAMLAGTAHTGRFCHGDSPTMADCCLVPQVYNAQRFAVSLEPYPTLRRINNACLQLQAFQRAAPEAQADA